MVEAIERIDPFPKVVGVRTIVVLIGRGWGGGIISPPVVAVMGVRGLPNEVVVFSSIIAQ
jgi:hypothetical protein